MYHLILVVISIALTASLSAAAIVYSPISAFERQRTLVSALNGVRNLEKATIRYLDFHRDEQGYVIYEGDNTVMGDFITPHYGFMPPAPRGFSWQIANQHYLGMPSVGICLINTDERNDYGAIFNALRTRLGPQAVTRGSGCNAGNDNPSGTSITYWVSLDHLAPLQAEELLEPEEG